MVAENTNMSQSAISSTNENGVKRASDNRRSNKPIMEKRRRARINNCLNQLKTLILDAMKKDPARHSKLEKADILEMTVKHLQNLQRAPSTSSDPSLASKFRAGYSECATEVDRYAGIETPVKRRLMQHLANCLAQQNNNNNASAKNQDVHQVHQAQGNIILGQNGVQLVPTRLPNGDIAFVLPNNNSQVSNGVIVSPSMPLLVPIPSRTPSTASASSSSSHYSSAESPEPMEVRYCPPMQKPLSLVMRKSNLEGEEDEKPWRPW